MQSSKQFFFNFSFTLNFLLSINAGVCLCYRWWTKFLVAQYTKRVYERMECSVLLWTTHAPFSGTGVALSVFEVFVCYVLVALISFTLCGWNIPILMNYFTCFSVKLLHNLTINFHKFWRLAIYSLNKMRHFFSVSFPSFLFSCLVPRSQSIRTNKCQCFLGSSKTTFKCSCCCS